MRNLRELKIAQKGVNLTDHNKLTMGEGFHQDAKVSNLRLMVSPLGKRSWYFYGHAPSEGKSIKKRFDDAETMSVKDARDHVKRLDVQYADKTKEKVGDVPTFQEVVDMRNAGWLTRTFDKHFKDWLPERLDAIDAAMVRDREAQVRRVAGATSRKRALQADKPLPLDAGGTAVTNAAKALRSVFKFAFDKELYRGANVGKVMTLAPDRTPRKVWLSDKQREDLLVALESDILAPWARPCFLIQLWTGTRWGALTKARWSDVDLVNKLWTIPPADAKNGEPNYVHLGKEAVEVFKEWRAANPNATLVFPSPKDPRKCVADVSFQWDKVKDLAGLHDIRPHDLRRTFGSMLVSKGAPMKVVSTMLNHKSVRVTEQVYAHVAPKAIHDALQLLD